MKSSEVKCRAKQLFPTTYCENTVKALLLLCTVQMCTFFSQNFFLLENKINKKTLTLNKSIKSVIINVKEIVLSDDEDMCVHT
jgi:predicted choloylglycine hydrolase